MVEKEVLITGTTGFLGGEIKSFLEGKGIIVHGTTNRGEHDPSRRQYKIDIRKKEEFATQLPQKTIPVIIHNAGIVDARVPKDFMWGVNVTGTANVLEWARKHGCQHFIQISSVAVYGFHMFNSKLKDEHTKRSLSTIDAMYMRSKAKAERLVEKGGIPFTILRIPPIVGPGDTVISPAIIPQLLEGELYFGTKKDVKFSLFYSKNIGPIIEKILERGPDNQGYNCCDFTVDWRKEYCAEYARQLGQEMPLQTKNILSILPKIKNDMDYVMTYLYSYAGAAFSNEKLKQAIGEHNISSYSWKSGVGEAIKAFFKQKNSKENTKKMKVLVTGAFGNIGMYTVRELLQQKYTVATFDVKNLANAQRAASLNGQIESFWGDICDPATLQPALKGVDVVVHLAAIIPPLSEKKPELAKKVNEQGTQTLLKLVGEQDPRPRLVFTSSISLFGDTLALAPPRTMADPIHPTDTYSHTKAECEALIHKSSIETLILRLAAVPAINMSNMDPIMFDIRLDTRMEWVHPADVARAIVNGITRNNAWGKTLLVGGGKECQLLYRDFMGGILETIGIGMFPDYAYGQASFYTDWLDTAETQRLLDFQRITYQEWLKEIPDMIGPGKIGAVKALRPFIRLWLLNKSPYWKAALQKAWTIEGINARIQTRKQARKLKK